MDEFDDDGDFDEQALRGFDEIESQFVQSATNALVGDNSNAPTDVVISTEAAVAGPRVDSTAVPSTSNHDVAERRVQVPLWNRPATSAPIPARAIASSSKTGRSASRAWQRSTSGSSRQTTLFGDVIPAQPSQGVLIQANKPNSAIGPATQQPIPRPVQSASNAHVAEASHSAIQRGKTKQWDFAQPINLPKKALKNEFFDLDDLEDLDDLDPDNDETAEFERAPEPVQADVDCLTRMKIQVDREAAKTWIYPTNKEKRDYQFNIVRRALFNNVLVALPTGLGKTFIAAVVILNYYRWFPTGKIIFVAPTKPLVAQQQIACHGICGLPWEAAIEMTGEVRATTRAEEWKSKRIFYMTPQTFENDLCSTAVDAHDVVCVVVDEAHRATGNYAYGKVIRHLMQRNPFFRVLALTATPGSNSDKVQEVVDSLHINLIEIRQEDALDIRKYVHTKEEDPVVVPLTGLVSELRGLLTQLMRPEMSVLIGAGVLQDRDPVSLSAFGIRQIYRDPRKRDVVNKRKLFQTISRLADLAQAMENLVKYSITMFANKMWALETGITAQGTKASTKKTQTKLQANKVVLEMRMRYEECQDQQGFVPHPKMDYIQNVIAAHFAQHEEREGENGRQTRVMVFCSLRECVTEIVALLNRVSSVKATQFVGQASDKKGNRGLRQKDQERIVADFKQGEFNVLVATSIGEEGLDIGEVDLIVCYEAVKNVVRMLQRVGRTGRQREGRIVVLMSEGPEQKNWQQSKEQYKTVQHDIIKGINLSLYDDVERLLPPDITSEVVEREVDQPPFEPRMIREAAKAKKSGAKRKRNSDPMRNVPEDASLGFVPVSKMRKAKGKGKQQRELLREGDDEEYEMPSSRSLLDEHLLPILDSLSEGGSSDEALERGLVIDTPPPAVPSSRSAGSNISGSDASRTRPRSLGVRRGIRASSSSRSSKESQDTIDDETDANARRIESVHRAPLGEASGRVNGSEDDGVRKADAVEKVVIASDVVSPSLARSSSPVIACRRFGRSSRRSMNDANAEDESEKSSEEESTMSVRSKSAAAKRQKKMTFLRRKAAPPPSSSPPLNHSMGPPAAPRRESKAKTGMEKKRKGSSAKRKKQIGDSPGSRRLFRFEADRFTDDEHHGELDENDEGDDRYVEDSSDREHVGDFAPTQAPKGYRQQAVYMQSLNTQTAPSIFGRPKRKGREVESPTVHRRVPRSTAASSASQGGGMGDDTADEYERGSFVCSDEDVDFDSDAGPLSSL